MTVVFELRVSLGEISKVRFEDAPPSLEDSAAWFVRCADDAVTVHALAGDRIREIASARFIGGRLVDRESIRPSVPSPEGWKILTTAVARARRRADERAPRWRRALAKIDPSSRRVLLGAVIMGVLAIGLMATLLFVVRRTEPAAQSLAPFDALTWRDVARGGETTIPLILKDPERERGRKLCVTGKVVHIERARVNGRDAHVGGLRPADGGDSINFIALGSTRSIVADSMGDLCGVAHGKRIVGLFDLPENR